MAPTIAARRASIRRNAAAEKNRIKVISPDTHIQPGRDRYLTEGE